MKEGINMKKKIRITLVGRKGTMAEGSAMKGTALVTKTELSNLQRIHRKTPMKVKVIRK